MPHPPTSPSDGDLLRAYIAGDQAAFAALVDRHARLVFAVCRSVLGHTHDAEDAAQAVFLTLSSKAPTLVNSPSLAAWLHRVAWYVAQRARAARAVRQKHEREVLPMTSSPASENLPDETLHAALSELPERYRNAILLHHLEGRSQQEIATLTNQKIGTVSSWLTRGRELLRTKLFKRGVSVSAVALSTALAAQSNAAVPAGFAAATVAATSTSAASVALLSQEALHMLLLAKIKTFTLATAVCVAFAGLGTAVTLAALPRPVAATGAPAAATPAGAITAKAETPIDIRGRLVGPDNQPIANHTIVVTHMLFTRPRVETLTTNQQGVFATQVHPRTMLRLTGVQYRDNLVVDDITGLDPTRNVSPILFSDGRSAKDITIRLAPGEAILQGTVTDDKNNPVPNARVTFYRLTNALQGTEGQARYYHLNGNTGSSAALVANTDKDGRYQLRVAPGMYGQWDVVGPAGSYLATEKHWADRGGVRATAGRAAEIPLRVSSTGSLRVQVLDAAGNPLPKATIRLSVNKPKPAFLNLPGMPVRQPDGSILLEGLPAGALSVLAIPSTEHVADASASADVTITRGQTADLTIRLVPQPNKPPETNAKTATFYGKITDADGRPVPGIQLTVAPDGAQRNLQTPSGLVTTNDKGEFALADLPATTLFIQIAPRPNADEAPASFSFINRIRRAPFAGAYVELPASEWVNKSYDIRMAPAIVTTLRFTAPGSPAALPHTPYLNIARKWTGFTTDSGASEEFVGPSGEIKILTPQTLFRPNGTTEKLEKLELRLTNTGSDRIPSPAGIQVDLKQNASTVNVALAQMPAITGTVLDPDGKPLAGAAVFPWKVDNNVRGPYALGHLVTYTNKDGLFTLTNLVDGTYDLEAVMQDERSICTADFQRVTVAADQPLPAGLTIRTIAGGSIEGRALDAKGEFVDAMIQVRRDKETAFLYDRIARYATSSRNYRIVRLPPGKYIVGVYRVDPISGVPLNPDARNEERVEVQAGKTTKLDLDIDDTTTKLP